MRTFALQFAKNTANCSIANSHKKINENANIKLYKGWSGPKNIDYRQEIAIFWQINTVNHILVT